MTKQEINQIRQETNGTQKVVHFNNAGASLMPDIVLASMIEYLKEETNYGGYETMAKYDIQLEHTYDAIAQLINADRSEIAVVESATNAWHLAFHSIDFKGGDIILTGMAEYATNYMSFLKLQKTKKVKIKVIPNDEHGQVDVKAMKKMISKKVKLIAITHIPTNSGLINPAKEIGAIAKKNNVLYLLDACQSVGQIPIDVKAIHCDFLSATGRKYLRAPRGTGFLYVKKSLLDAGLEPPFIDLFGAEWTGIDTYEMRPDARRFEVFESNRAAKYGLAMAVDYALSIGMDRIAKRITILGQLLREKLATIPKVTVHDIGKQKGGIVSFSIEGLERDAIIQTLLKKGINTSPIFENGTRLDMEDRNLGNNLVRASIHYYNTEKEINRFCTAIKEL